MRREFSERLHLEMGINEDIYLLTGDLGYGLWDKIRIDYPSRFYNVGSSEQLMMGMASGLAMDGKIPVVYSITPFLLYRPFETIRNYVDHEKLPVKLIGGGRDRYLHLFPFLGAVLEDKEVTKIFKNIKTIHPPSVDSMNKSFNFVVDRKTPLYMNLKR